MAEATTSSLLLPAELTDAERDQLTEYLEPVFARPKEKLTFPAPDEPSVAAWQGYRDLAANGSVWPILQARLPQLQFAIRSGVSEEEAYRVATRRGTLPKPGESRDTLVLKHPGALRLTLHPTPAGRIPVLEPYGREDFVSLVRAFLHKSEPSDIPGSMGAVMIAGFNNWDRIAQIRKAWLAEGNSDDDWNQFFRDAVIPNKPAYQDRLILLSRGSYSDLPEKDMPMEAPTWIDTSRTIRLEHECTHYFTRRICNSMRNNLFDELIADYRGLVTAFGTFDADLFLRLMGVLPSGKIKEGGRVMVYRGGFDPGGRAFGVILSYLRRAAQHLAELHETEIDGFEVAEATPDQINGLTLLALTFLSLPKLADDDFVNHFRAAREDAITCLRI